jgi:hypothetical protein
MRDSDSRSGCEHRDGPGQLVRVDPEIRDRRNLLERQAVERSVAQERALASAEPRNQVWIETVVRDPDLAGAARRFCVPASCLFQGGCNPVELRPGSNAAEHPKRNSEINFYAELQGRFTRAAPRAGQLATMRHG